VEKKLDISSLFSNSEDLQKKWNNCLKIFHIQLDEDINLICGNISNNTLLGTHGLVQDDDKIEKKLKFHFILINQLVVLYTDYFSLNLMMKKLLKRDQF